MPDNIFEIDKGLGSGIFPIFFDLQESAWGIEVHSELNSDIQLEANQPVDC